MCILRLRLRLRPVSRLVLSWPGLANGLVRLVLPRGIAGLASGFRLLTNSYPYTHAYQRLLPESHARPGFLVPLFSAPLFVLPHLRNICTYSCCDQRPPVTTLLHQLPLFTPSFASNSSVRRSRRIFTFVLLCFNQPPLPQTSCSCLSASGIPGGR